MSAAVETMAYAGEVPWHGLGVKVDSTLSPEEMRKAAGLDWDVEKIKTFYDYNGIMMPTGQEAVVRVTDGQFMSQVSEKWAPVQNKDAFAFFEDFIKEGDMEMHTAGSLQDGKIVWVLAKVKESFKINGKSDQIDSYLLFTNPFIYGKATDVRFSPIRVVCNNTLNMALGQGGEAAVKVNHCKAFDADFVKRTLGIAHNKMNDYKEVAEFLASTKYTAETVHQFFNDIFPASGKKAEAKELSRNAELALENLNQQPGAELFPDTWWNAFNSVTYLTDHVLGHSDESRLNSAWYGTNRNKKVAALDSAVEYAKAA